MNKWAGLDSELTRRLAFKLRLAPQLPKELPYIRHHQFGLFPKSKMTSTGHFRVVHQIIIAGENALRRIETRCFLWQ